jgi:predicted ribosomally synthesized peptide with nif11-like leader
MAQDDIKQFLDEIRKDAALQAQLKTQPDSHSFFDAVARLAAERGYNFSSEELKTYLAAPKSSSEELTDAELAAVAGGGLIEMIKGMLTISGGTCSRTGEVSACYSGTSRA